MKGGHLSAGQPLAKYLGAFTSTSISRISVIPFIILIINYFEPDKYVFHTMYKITVYIERDTVVKWYSIGLLPGILAKCRIGKPP